MSNEAKYAVNRISDLRDEVMRVLNTAYWSWSNDRGELELIIAQYVSAAAQIMAAREIANTTLAITRND